MIVGPNRAVVEVAGTVRRRCLIAATLAGMGLTRAASSAPSLVTATLPSAPIPQGGPGLGQFAAANHRRYGVALKSNYVAEDPAYVAAVLREAGLVMPEYETKWAVLQPAEGRFNFGPLDGLLAWAGMHRLPVRGHALVWHQDLPQWTLAALAESPQRAQAVMEAHIGRVLAHTQGAIREWDVVNEVVADPAGSDTPQAGPAVLRDTPFLRALGPGYIVSALRVARSDDPRIRTALNEYGLEEAAPHHFEKRRRFLDLVRSLRAAGAPLDAVGLQGHMQMVQPFAAAPFTAFCRQLRAEGLELVVTEMDIREHWRIPDGFAARDRLVADRVKAFVDAAIDGGVGTFITWGLENRYSWLASNPYVKRPDGLEHRGLPLDDDGQRTPYWMAMAEAFGRPKT